MTLRSRKRGIIMAKVIEFYVPASFHKKVEWASSLVTENQTFQELWLGSPTQAIWSNCKHRPSRRIFEHRQER